MHSQSKSSQSSMNSSQSYKETNLHRFIASISHTLLHQMKKYLAKNQFKQSLKRKISLYEDIYTMVALKQNEEKIFGAKIQMRRIIQQIANKFKRKYVTIYQRVNRKLSQLTQQQIQYLIQTDQPLIFRNNSRRINNDHWPEHLRSSNFSSQSHFSPSDDDRIINLESQSSSQSKQSVPRSHRIIWRNPNDVRQFKKKLQFKKKPTQQNYHVIENVETIMCEQQGSELSSSISKNAGRNTQRQKPNDKKLYDLSDPSEKEIFSNDIITKWRQKNLPKIDSNSDNFLKESKICYNFLKRQYILLNPNLMQSVWNNLKQQQLRNVIRQKQESKNKKEKSNNEIMQMEIYSSGEQKRYNLFGDQNKIEIFSPKPTVRQDQIMKESKKQSIQNDNKISLQSEQNKQHSSSKLFNREQIPQHQGPITQLSELLDSKKIYSEMKSQNNSQCKGEQDNLLKIKNPIQMLQEIASKCDINSVTPQVKELLEKGMAIKQKLANWLEEQYHGEEQNVMDQQEDNLKGIWPKQLQKDEQNQINNRPVFEKALQQPSKPMVYWFNNDPNIYEVYQENPYKLGHLMWTEQEDQLIFKANRNLEEYIEQFKFLIKQKTPKYLISRIRFLKLIPSVYLYSFINSFLSSNQMTG